MTILNNGTRNQYTATASQTVFTYNFEIFDEDHIKVYQNNALLTIVTDYTVSGVGAENGGDVTLVVGATSGDTITLNRETPAERTVDYQNSGEFLADDVNVDFDTLWAVIQELRGDGDRTLQVPVTSTTTSLTFEAPVVGQVLRWKDANTVDSVAVDQDSKAVVNDAGGSRTLTLADVTVFTRFTSASATNLTVPNDASASIPVNSEIEIRQAGAGLVTLVAGGGVTITPPFGGTLALAGVGATVMVKKVAANTWDLIGQVGT